MQLTERVLGILLVGLFAVAMISCGTDTKGSDDENGDGIVETVDGTTVVDIPDAAFDGTTVVDIPDAALRATIAVTLEIQDDTSITVDDMLGLTVFSVPAVDIVNLVLADYSQSNGA